MQLQLDRFIARHRLQIKNVFVSISCPSPFPLLSTQIHLFNFKATRNIFGICLESVSCDVPRNCCCCCCCYVHTFACNLEAHLGSPQVFPHVVKYLLTSLRNLHEQTHSRCPPLAFLIRLTLLLQHTAYA